MRVAIAGGGIGGLTAAIGLRQAGIDVAVYERATTLDKIQIGGGVTLWHNAVLALRKLGLGDKAEAVAPVITCHQFRSWRGPDLAYWPVDQQAEKLGAPTLGISRPNLHLLLMEEAGDSLHLGKRCAGFEADDDGVTVRFTDGGEERFDALIGADGINSVVRGQLLGVEPPRYSGYTAWQGVVEMPDRTVVPDGVFMNSWGKGLRFLWFRIDKGDLLYWDGVTSDREGGKEATQGTKKDTLLHRFRGWFAPVEEVITATDESTITVIDIFDREPAMRWGRGRVSLLGDAAHPSTFNLGQGAAQAIEDGLVLSQCLAQTTDVASALRLYERRRMDRTASMTKTARRIGNIGRWKNPAVIRFRETFMRAAFGGPVMRADYKLMMGFDW